MVEHVRCIHANLETLRFIHSERFARTGVETPISQRFEIPEAKISDLSGLGVLQQHFSRGPVGIALGQSHNGTDGCRLKIGTHLIPGSDLRRICALRIRDTRVGVPV